MSDVFTVVFLGHRDVDHPIEIKQRLEKLIQKLIEKKEHVNFLIGSKGGFGQCAASSVCYVREKYGCHNSTLALGLPYVTTEYRNSKEHYHDDGTDMDIFCAVSGECEEEVIRDCYREMVDRADLIICYIKRKEGAAWQAAQYALRQCKQIINMMEET